MRKPFLTPPETPVALECRQLTIPSSIYWLGIFNSALLETIYAYNYEQVNDTDLTPDETAAICYGIYEDYIATSGCLVPAQTPFWDDGSDVDDSEPANSQQWYGEVNDPEAPAGEISFIDNLGIWVFTGLIAASGNIGAAIFFNTIAPKFVVSLRRGDLPSIIRLIVDGADYGRYDLTDMTEGEILDVSVLPYEEATIHEILIVKAG